MDKTKFNKKLPLKIGVDLVYSLFIFVPFFSMLVLGLSSHELFTQNSLEFAEFFIFLMLLMAVVIFSIRIILDEDSLTYKALFTKKKILYQDITDISVATRIGKNSYIKLILKSKNKNGDMDPNIAALGRNIYFVEKYLLEKCPQATTTLNIEDIDKNLLDEEKAAKIIKKIFLVFFLINLFYLFYIIWKSL